MTSVLFDIWGLPIVDLFASQLSIKIESFCSQLPEPFSLHGNFLQADWLKGLLQMHLPLPHLSLALHKVIREEAILPW